MRASGADSEISSVAHGDLVQSRPRAARAESQRRGADALGQVLKAEPNNLSALLQKGEVETAQGRTRAAAMTYRTLLQILPPGFQPPPWMEAPLQKAQQIVDANAQALEAYVAEGLHALRSRHADQ